MDSLAAKSDFPGPPHQIWETEYTKVVTSDPRTYKGTPDQRLLGVMRMVETGDLAVYDRAFQVWARKDGLAREAS